jgi:hypothetical protein
VSITGHNPVTKAALVLLGDVWPRGIRWHELLTMSQDHLRAGGLDADQQPDAVLRADLLSLHAMGVVELRHKELPESRGTIHPPAAIPIARWQAARLGLITTATHQCLGLSATDRAVVTRLTGTQALTDVRDAVVDELRDAAASSEVPEAMTVEQWVESRLGRCLAVLGSWGLLE